MAQLKDLIVNGPTRLIGPAYGKITSADTVPVVNNNVQMAYGQQSIIAVVGGINITASLPAGGSQGPQGNQGSQGSQGSQGAQGSQGEAGTTGNMLWTNDSGLNITGKSATVWTGTTGSNSGVGQTVHFSNLNDPTMQVTGLRTLQRGDIIGFWGQDTDGNGHLNLAYLSQVTSNGGKLSVTGQVATALIAEKGAQGNQGNQGNQGSPGSNASLAIKGAGTDATCFLIGTTATTATGSNATLSTSNTFRAGNATGTGVYYKNNQLYASSDDRLKDYGDDIKVDLDDIARIPKKYFTWKSDGPQGQVLIGTSAQGLRAVYPELVSGDESKEMLAVSYDRLGVIALAAVDELHKENQKLKEEIEELKKQLEYIRNINQLIG